jgi:hypothetical protein
VSYIVRLVDRFFGLASACGILDSILDFMHINTIISKSHTGILLYSPGKNMGSGKCIHILF